MSESIRTRLPGKDAYRPPTLHVRPSASRPLVQRLHSNIRIFVPVLRSQQSYLVRVCPAGALTPYAPRTFCPCIQTQHPSRLDSLCFIWHVLNHD
jgi:hypothetical protein